MDFEQCPKELLLQYGCLYGFMALRALLVATIGLLAIYLLRTFLKKQLYRIFTDKLRINVVVRIISYILLFLLATIVLQGFGVDMTALIGAAGVVGVAIGFASQTSIANIISGLFLTMEHPFELDDTVVINNIEGKVKSLDLFAVTLNTTDNRLVRIPNEQVLKNTIINLTKQFSRRYQFTIDLAPSADAEQAIQLIKQVIDEHPLSLKDRSPLIFPTSISGDKTELFVGAWTTQKEWGSFKKSLLLDIRQAFKKHNIPLASTRTCYLKTIESK